MQRPQGGGRYQIESKNTLWKTQVKRSGKFCFYLDNPQGSNRFQFIDLQLLWNANNTSTFTFPTRFSGLKQPQVTDWNWKLVENMVFLASHQSRHHQPNWQKSRDVCPTLMLLLNAQSSKSKSFIFQNTFSHKIGLFQEQKKSNKVTF